MRGLWSGRRARRLPEDAGGREAGYSQLARAPYASMAYRCVFRGGFVPNNGGIGENGAEPSDAWPVRPIFLNGLKRGTPRACNLLNGKLSPQTSSFLKTRS